MSTATAPKQTIATVDAVPAEDAGRVRELLAQTFLPYQLAWIHDGSDFAIWAKGRQVGSAYTESFRAVIERLTGARTLDYWYTSADEGAAQEFMQHAKRWLELFGVVAEVVYDTLPFESGDIRVMQLTLPAIGNRRPRITALSSSPSAIRGKTGDVTLDEFALHRDPEGMLAAAMPVATHGGRVRIISTRRFGTKFNAMVDGAKRHADPDKHGAPKHGDQPYSLHQVYLPDAIEQGLVEVVNRVNGTSYTAEEFYERCRMIAGDQATFEQEYLGIDNEDGDSYFPYAMIRQAVRGGEGRDADAKPVSDPLDWITGLRARIVGEDKEPRFDYLVAGCDVARTKDIFVIWVFGVRGGMRRTVGSLTMRGVGFDVMEHAITWLMRVDARGAAGKCRVRRLCMDATGMGMQLAERASAAFGSRVEAVTMTSTVKADLFTRARRDLEEKTITLPDDPQTLADLNGVRRTITSAGNIRYDLERNADGHSDRAVAIALALHADEHKSKFRTVAIEPGVLA